MAPTKPTKKKQPQWQPPAGSVRLSVYVSQELLWSVRQAAAAERMTIRQWTTGLIERELRRRRAHHQPTTARTA
jgi:hypothetical protein